MDDLHSFAMIVNDLRDLIRSEAGHIAYVDDELDALSMHYDRLEAALAETRDALQQLQEENDELCTVNIYSSLTSELREKEYRDAYVAAQITFGLPLQARALRLARGWTQEQLAERAEMTQPRIAEIEKPRKRRFNLETLLRIASAFDVGLQVRFVPLTAIIDDAESFNPDAFDIKPFTQELSEAEELVI